MSRTQTLADIIGIEPNRRISALQVAYMRAAGDKAMGPDPLAQGDCAWDAWRLALGCHTQPEDLAVLDGTTTDRPALRLSPSPEVPRY